MSSDTGEPARHFTGVRPMMAEGARIGFVSCLTCGAALVLDPGDDIDLGALHLAWHEDNGGDPK